MSITVEVRHDNVEKAMRVLKKKMLKAGILKEYREKQYYRKPTLFLFIFINSKGSILRISFKT